MSKRKRSSPTKVHSYDPAFSGQLDVSFDTYIEQTRVSRGRTGAKVTYSNVSVTSSPTKPGPCGERPYMQMPTRRGRERSPLRIENVSGEDTDEDIRMAEEKIKGKSLRGAKDDPLRAWADAHSKDYLYEFLRHESPPMHHYNERGQLSCAYCQSSNTAVTLYKCKDCFAGSLHCSSCTLKMHQYLPLHRILKWNGYFFEKSSLFDLNLVVYAGHEGRRCDLQSAPIALTVVDLSGIHSVQVSYCGCSKIRGQTKKAIQLLRMKWFPASHDRPRTVVTFDALEFFHLLSTQGKTNLYDFYETLLKRVDNSGLGASKDLKRGCMSAFRQYRYLKLLKRHGQGHDSVGIEGIQDGACAVECPACPHPGRNLPEDWMTCKPELRFLYTLMLSMDANFRLKAKDRGLHDSRFQDRYRDRGVHDIRLGDGLSYFVKYKPFLEHILEATSRNTVEVNTCGSRLKAIDHANSRYSQGYIATGVAVVVCARHTFIRKNGAGDLQKGERYVNMDYVLLSTLIGVLLMNLLIVYDIACQWCKNFEKERIFEFPEHMQLNAEDIDIEYVIPKAHINGHGEACRTAYSLNFIAGSARTDGEGVERDWAHMNGLATSTREMTPGNRHETIDDHWGAWNWQKEVKLGVFLARKLEEAIRNHAIQVEQHDNVKQQFSKDLVEAWDNAIVRWEKNHKAENPYEIAEAKGRTLTEVRIAIAKEEAEILRQEKEVFPHEVTPGAFLHTGLELEDQQRALTYYENRAKANKDSSRLASVLTRRNVLQRRLNNFFRIQLNYIPAAAELRERMMDNMDTNLDDNSSSDHSPQSVPLYLPSQLPATVWRTGCMTGLHELELRYRLAQISDTFEDLKTQLCVYSSLVKYKITEMKGEGQKALTRNRNTILGTKEKAEQLARRYRAVRKALEILSPQGDWRKKFQVLAWKDVRAPSGMSLDDDDLLSVPKRQRMGIGTGEGSKKISWIWTVRASRDHDREDTDTFVEEISKEKLDLHLRVEYARSRARVSRWGEEKLLLLEAMRRTLEFLRWKAKWWNDHSSTCSAKIEDVLRGAQAYASRQESQLIKLGKQFVTIWKPILEANDINVEWIDGMDAYETVVPITAAARASLSEAHTGFGKTMAARGNIRTSRGGNGNLHIGDIESDYDDGVDDFLTADCDMGDVVYDDDMIDFGL